MVEEQENLSGLASDTLAPNHKSLDDNNGDVKRVGKSRHRKKALHASILKLMEFYFSDANLNKDRFLNKLIEANPYVDLSVFLKFNKIRNLTDETSRIAKALSNSTILELSDDKKRVKRSTPICQKQNIEDCMIYVEGLSIDTDHDWLSSVFSRYGPVDYVSIPRYNNTKKIKGYAFVEFAKAEDAKKCLKEFTDQNCTLPSQIAPHDLMSIKTFSDDDQSTNNTVVKIETSQEVAASSSSSTSTTTKRPLDNGADTEDDCKPSEIKKARLMNDDDNDDGYVDEEEETTNEVVTQSKDQDEDKKKQKKKNRKRRDRNEQPYIEDYGLRIMSKTDWRILRNKYLNMQRERMKQLKQDLKKTRMSPYSYDQRDATSTSSVAVATSDVPRPTPRPRPPATDDGSLKKPKQELQPKFTFTEGLIVKIELDEHHCTDAKSLKSEFRNDTNVKYIDIHDGTNIIYVRCDTPEGTNKFVEKYSDEKTVTVLTGDEEKLYWDKMNKDRAQKFEKKNRKENKQRGRDKLLKKAEKELGKHIRFDDV
ncbi:la-related protein 7-like [Aphidius gifuensis]|uniref:la-related protein 7-like n=1 Tax=Aphidius gifuensis TaxID=684658 RepID=UPI001CDC4C45|nr:la-related protein 7-like [Aphidius gifuensis]